ncbi:MAG: hypothetical protein IJ142_07415 [Bacteroidaceae bacterium]|nr:hypothetical protein [Bacteroidaceae bacterium]
MNEPKLIITVMPGAQMNGYVKEQNNYFAPVQQVESRKTEDNPTIDVEEATTVEPNHSDSKGNIREPDAELFHFVHPELDETEAWRIHDAVKRVVKLQGIQMICQYLTGLKNEKKVLLPPNPAAAYAELVRMGMPNGEGFNETTFRKYYNKPETPNRK